MARAKTTQRAEARRRYRAQIAESDAADEQEMAAEASANRLANEGVANRLGAPRTTARPRAGVPPRTGASGQERIGIVEAFRRSSQTADIPGDLRALPTIARSTKAVWLPTLLIVATGVAYLVPGLSANAVVAFLVTAVLAPPAMIPSFLAGMLTQRGSWLAGAIAGLLSAVMAVVIITLAPSSKGTGSMTDVATILLIGPVFGGGIGAFAGFYRRFLTFSSPPRQQQRRAKPARRR